MCTQSRFPRDGFHVVQICADVMRKEIRKEIQTVVCFAVI